MIKVLMISSGLIRYETVSIHNGLIIKTSLVVVLSRLDIDNTEYTSIVLVRVVRA